MEQGSNLLLERMNATKDKSEYRRIRGVYLYTVEKMSGPIIAKALGCVEDTVYRWVACYKAVGIDGLIAKPRGGRRWAYMTLEEEKALLNQITPEANKGLVVVSFIVRKAVEEKLCHSVSPDYAEDLLNRHGWRKVTPRTKHPKSSKEEQEEFKKKHQNSSKKQQVHLTHKIVDL